MATQLAVAPPPARVRVVGIPADLAQRLAAPVLGLAAALLALIGSGTPSLWGDEAASVMSAQRSIPSLFHELTAVDAVHGLYYLGLHVWIGLVGDSAFAVRLPSVVAAGFAVAGIVVLGRRLFGPAVGLVAGGVLAVIPEFTQLSVDARSYEMIVAASIWTSVLLVRLVTRPQTSRWLWVAYAAAVAATVWLWMFSAMLLIAHLALVLALRASGSTRRRFAASVVGVVAVTAPILLVGYRQRRQIAFLGTENKATLEHVLVSQWFGTLGFALVAWALVLVGLAVVLHRPGIRRRRGLAVAAWALAPMALILLVNALVLPIYNGRYLAFSMPGVALLMAIAAVGIVRVLRRRRVALAAAAGVALAGVLVAGAAPAYLVQRGPWGEGGADFRETAQVLQRHAQPGDAVVFDRTVKASQRPRVIEHLYPADVAGLADIGLRTPFTARAGIWDTTRPVADLGPELADHPVVWALEVRGSGSPDLVQLERLGYRVTARYPVHITTAYRLERETS